MARRRSKRTSDIVEKVNTAVSENSVIKYVKSKLYLKAYLILVVLVFGVGGTFLLDPDLGFITSLTYGTLFINSIMFIMFGALSAGLLWLTGSAFTDWGKYGDPSTLVKAAIEENNENAARVLLSIQLRWIAIAIVLAAGFLAIK